MSLYPLGNKDRRGVCLVFVLTWKKVNRPAVWSCGGTQDSALDCIHSLFSVGLQINPAFIPTLGERACGVLDSVLARSAQNSGQHYGWAYVTFVFRNHLRFNPLYSNVQSSTVYATIRLGVNQSYEIPGPNASHTRKPIPHGPTRAKVREAEYNLRRRSGVERSS